LARQFQSTWWILSLQFDGVLGAHLLKRHCSCHEAELQFAITPLAVDTDDVAASTAFQMEEPALERTSIGRDSISAS